MALGGVVCCSLQHYLEVSGSDVLDAWLQIRLNNNLEVSAQISNYVPVQYLRH